MSDLKLALAIAFGRPSAYLVAAASAAAMAVLLVWASGLLTHYPTGWEVYASPQEWVTIGTLSTLFGLLLPLQVAALVKARSAVASASGLAGAVGGILSVSCCAPLLLPALLSFVGFSGTALVSFNAAVSAYATPLTLASITLMAGSIGFVSHTIAAGCTVRPVRSGGQTAAG